MRARRLSAEVLNAVRKLVAEKKTAQQIGDELGFSRSAIVGMVHRHQLGKLTGRATPRRRAPLPGDFTTIYDRMTERAAAAHYGVHRDTVSSWAVEAGIKRERVQAEPRVRPSRPLARTYYKAHAGPPPAAYHPHRDGSRAGQAAVFLQQFGAVYRCNQLGQPEPRGDFWRRGTAVLTGEELIGRAERNGWKPNAWSEPLPTNPTTTGARA